MAKGNSKGRGYPPEFREQVVGLHRAGRSARSLAAQLQDMGHDVSYHLVADLLAELDYSLQGNRKTREGPQHSDRDAHFRYINDQVCRFLRKAQPAIFRRYQEEGAGRRLQEPRTRMATERQS